MYGDPNTTPMSKAEAVVAEATNSDSAYDPNGSYTGKPVDEDEKPVQDADDL